MLAMPIDAVDLEVLKASLSGIVQEMQNSLFRTGFLDDLASDFFDSSWAKLRRICSIKSGTPVTCLSGAGTI